ncbi:hypothetical protein Acr_09g0002040 [Actinidia rufa]|uniref:Uncharacterized protein n=1 Tax=Actinidia rufa TaxID=165716 RepID=A0A7J0F4Y4_9ERIC|nr:hypothetical protein Acr_09g0002040 [Actinidia rufa]
MVRLFHGIGAWVISIPVTPNSRMARLFHGVGAWEISTSSTAPKKPDTQLHKPSVASKFRDKRTDGLALRIAFEDADLHSQGIIVPLSPISFRASSHRRRFTATASTLAARSPPSSGLLMCSDVLNRYCRCTAWWPLLASLPMSPSKHALAASCLRVQLISLAG